LDDITPLCQGHIPTTTFLSILMIRPPLEPPQSGDYNGGTIFSNQLYPPSFHNTSQFLRPNLGRGFARENEIEESDGMEMRSESEVISSYK
jgi:hypothetical protein